MCFQVWGSRGVNSEDKFLFMLCRYGLVGGVRGASSYYFAMAVGNLRVKSVGPRISRLPGVMY